MNFGEKILFLFYKKSKFYEKKKIIYFPVKNTFNELILMYLKNIIFYLDNCTLLLYEVEIYFRRGVGTLIPCEGSLMIFTHLKSLFEVTFNGREVSSLHR